MAKPRRRARRQRPREGPRKSPRKSQSEGDRDATTADAEGERTQRARTRRARTEQADGARGRSRRDEGGRRSEVPPERARGRRDQGAAETGKGREAGEPGKRGGQGRGAGRESPPPRGLERGASAPLRPFAPSLEDAGESPALSNGAARQATPARLARGPAWRAGRRAGIGLAIRTSQGMRRTASALKLRASVPARLASTHPDSRARRPRAPPLRRPRGLVPRGGPRSLFRTFFALSPFFFRRRCTFAAH